VLNTIVKFLFLQFLKKYMQRIGQNEWVISKIMTLELTQKMTEKKN